MSNNFYVYAYLRNKDSVTAKAGTPYYIGKGIDNRAYVKHVTPVPKDKNNIIFLKENLTEQEAHNLEIELIAKFGRKDLGTGILNNKTNGGEGLSNPSAETRKKLSEAKRNESDETRQKRSESAKNRIRTPHSNETKNKIGTSNKGKTRTEETREKMANAKIGKPSYVRTDEIKQKQQKPQQQVECPYCNKVGGISAMKMWHFEKCKYKGHQ